MIKIHITAVLGDIWIEPELEGTLSDPEWLELINEDIQEVLDNAVWQVERDGGGPGPKHRMSNNRAFVLVEDAPE